MVKDHLTSDKKVEMLVLVQKSLFHHLTLNIRSRPLSVNGLWANGEHDGNGNAGTVAASEFDAKLFNSWI